MRPVLNPTRWAETLAGSHRAVIRGTVLPSETPIELAGGTVTLDGTAAIRGRCDLTVADPTLMPESASDLLAPYGNEIRVERGVEYSDETTELVSIGVFGIQRPSLKPNDAVRVTGNDRSKRISDARFESPVTVVAGTNVAIAIRDILRGAWGAIPMSFIATTVTTPTASAEEGGDPWAFCQSLATGAGLDLYFDGGGTCVLRTTPIGVSGPPVAQFVEGAGGVLLDAERAWDREGAYNRWIVTGENVNEVTPYRAVATDDDPTSPTYYYGKFGKVPKFFQSELIQSALQASDAANAMKARELGTTQLINFGTIVNPALEPDDTIRIRRESLGIDEDNLIQSLSIPLSPQEAMAGVCRAARSGTET